MERDSFNVINDSSRSGLSSRMNQVIYTAKVISNTDPLDAMRIKCKITSLDTTISNDDDKLFCNPFDSIANWNIPKVGETVYVIIPDPSKPYSNRLWKGPIIPQQQFIEESPFPQALATSNKAFIEAKKPISTIPQAKGSYPTKDEQSIQGRKNAALTFSDTQATLKASMYTKGKPEEKNRLNSPYIKVDNSEDPKNRGNDISTTTCVADFINLVSYNGLNGSNFRPEDMTKEELINFAKNSYSLLRGEPVISLLEKIIKLLVTHTHNYNTLPCETSTLVEELQNFDFSQIINKGVKTN